MPKSKYMEIFPDPGIEPESHKMQVDSLLSEPPGKPKVWVAQSLSNSLPQHGLDLTRLLCSWNSPDKNIGVGSHFFYPEDLPNPGIKPQTSALQANSLRSQPPGKPHFYSDSIKTSQVAQHKESVCQCRRCRRFEFESWAGKIPWRRKRQPPIFLPGKSHGQRMVAGYCPWDH